MKNSKFTVIVLSLLTAVWILIACGGRGATPVEVAPGEEKSSAAVSESQSGFNAASVEFAIDVPTPGQNYFVDPNGSDANEGSQNSPWGTLQHAVDTIAPGDTISLQSGAYLGARIEQSGNPEAWMVLQAAPGASVLINAPGPNNRHDSNLEFETWEGDETVSYWVVRGIEVANAPNWGIDFRGSEGDHSHHFIVQNNVVHDNGHDGETTGIFFAFVDDVVVEGNESYRNGEHGIYLSNSGDRFVVRSNRLHHNTYCGLHINGDLESGADGIISDGLVENNIIHENGVGGCSGINMDGVDTATIRNNVLVNNHAGGISLYQENGAICTQNVQILNNTIVQAEDGRWTINISADECVNNKIFNNIILTFHEWRGSILIPSAGLNGFESDHNIVMDRFSPDDDNSVVTLSEWQALGFDSNSMLASPDELFAGSNDYHLLPGSPAVDSGGFLDSVEADLEGVARPQGAAFDIGAFEFDDARSNSDNSQSQSTQAENEPSNKQQGSAPGEGTITYTFEGQVFRLAAQEGAVADNISLALDRLSPGGGDGLLNVSPDGKWLLLETERFDGECDGWACLALVAGDLSSGEAIRAAGQVVHTEGFSAVASGGNLIIFPYGEGPHEVDLWAITRAGDIWNAPFLLTADSPHEFNNFPAISDDGSAVIFNCGAEPYGGEGTAICEVGTDGSDFNIVLTPEDSPASFPNTGALHSPDYAPDGSIVFEADWNGEQIWRLPLDASEPIRVADAYGNDNSPCLLPDGRIVSLWLDRPAGNGTHEIKVMASDGNDFFMALSGVDLQDVGIGCAK